MKTAPHRGDPVRYAVWLKELRARCKLPGHCKQCGEPLQPPAGNELDCHSCNPPSQYETRTVGSK
jgi:hypothetical protein